MTTLADLEPGDIGFARHVRPKVVDLLIGAGQAALGETGYPHHVFVVTQAGRWLPRGDDEWVGPKIVQAMPSGAEEIEIGEEFWTPDFTYIRPEYEPNRLGAWQAYEVAQAARSYTDTPYSFLDYAAIAGVHFGIKDGPIRRYVTSSKHMICSQLADQAMSDVGWHVFDDGRLPQDVTPASLFRKMLTMPGRHVTPGDAAWMANGS